MKNIILLISLFFVAQYAIASVVQPSDDMIEKDLKFHYDDRKVEDDKRKLASDKKSSEDDKKRDVASEENDTDTPKIQFWDY